MKYVNVTNEARIIPSRERSAYGRTGGLNSVLSINDINAALGFRAQQNKPSSDNKTTRCWTFTVNGISCSIWDYKGYRWSTSGPHYILQAIFGENYTADVYPGVGKAIKVITA